MKYTSEQRQHIIENATGKTIANLFYEEDGEYWVMEFDDGSEASLRFMAELV